MLEYLTSMHGILGSIPAGIERKRKGRERKKKERKRKRREEASKLNFE